MTDDLMQMKCENDTNYAEFRKMFTDTNEAISRIRMTPSFMKEADVIEKFIEKLLRNRIGHIRSIHHERNRHRVWKSRAKELGWKGEEK